MESLDPRIPNSLYAMMIMMILMIDGKLCSTNTEFILCDDDNDYDNDECLLNVVICLASDYQAVVMPKERSLARIVNDKQTVHPKHSLLNT